MREHWCRDKEPNTNNILGSVRMWSFLQKKISEIFTRDFLLNTETDQRYAFHLGMGSIFKGAQLHRKANKLRVRSDIIFSRPPKRRVCCKKQIYINIEKIKTRNLLMYHQIIARPLPSPASCAPHPDASETLCSCARLCLLLPYAPQETLTLFRVIYT